MPNPYAIKSSQKSRALENCALQHLVSTFLAGIGVATLVFSALHDVSFRTVPNWASIVLLAIGLSLHALYGGLLWGMILSVIVLLITFTLWRMGWMGGGDVKLLSATTILVPLQLVPNLIIDTALAGGALAILYLLASRLAPNPPITQPAGLYRRVIRAELWRMRRRGPLPYAAAIATGGVLATLAW